MKAIGLLIGLLGMICLGSPSAAQTSNPPADVSAAEEEAPLFTVPANLGPEGAAFVSGMNAFAVDLYKANIAPEQNLFISPASVSTALAMAYRGARGATADDIRKVMRFPVAPEAISEGGGALMSTLS